MITHANVLWTGVSLLRAFGLGLDELQGMRVVSYLPMAHIAERMTSHYNAIQSAFVISSCPDTGKIAEYLREVKPHIGFGVPRIWEKIAAGVEAALGADPEKKQKFDEAVAAATPIVAKRTLEGDDVPHRGGAGHARLPRRGGVQAGPRPGRPRRDAARHHRARRRSASSSSSGTGPSASP